MNLTLIRSMTRSAVFELENELCYRPAHPFTVALNGKTIYEACNTNVFSDRKSTRLNSSHTLAPRMPSSA